MPNQFLPVLGIGIELACNGGSCWGISLERDESHLHLKTLISCILVIRLLKHGPPRLAFASCGHALFLFKYDLKITKFIECKTPRISLSCKLVPAQYREYENGLPIPIKVIP